MGVFNEATAEHAVEVLPWRENADGNTTTYDSVAHPQTNGKLERVHGEMQRKLRSPLNWFLRVWSHRVRPCPALAAQLPARRRIRS